MTPQRMLLLTHLLNCPLVGVTRKGVKVLHAVDMEGLAKGKRTTSESRCGKRVHLFGVIGRTGNGTEYETPYLWPPYVADMPEYTRCSDCLKKSERPRRITRDFR